MRAVALIRCPVFDLISGKLSQEFDYSDKYLQKIKSLYSEKSVKESRGSVLGVSAGKAGCALTVAGHHVVGGNGVPRRRQGSALTLLRHPLYAIARVPPSPSCLLLKSLVRFRPSLLNYLSI